ncbi:MAG: SIMPL domain-containing protein [Caulobacteraceae bacterium]|nr:SIMPL domain-containing protein [Caulobacteraceae bacterium]
MRSLVIGVLVACSLAPVTWAAQPPETALAEAVQTPPAPLYGRAPWWMRTPIIAATGEVQTHIPANRASFSAQFSAVDSSVAVATRNVIEQVRALAQTLQAYGADKAQVETGLSITPIYQQYRDKQGQMQTNEQADRIEKYQANLSFSVQVRDISILERAYAATVSARPTSIARVSFSLEPNNGTNTELFTAAVADAARRAKLAAEATGAHLTKVMLIDPTARACDTDVLVTGAANTYADDAGGVQEVIVTAQRRSTVQGAPIAAMAPPPPSPGEEVSPSDLLPQQPPLERLERKACVIYGLE